MLARYPEREAGNCCDKVDQDFPYSSTEFNTCISEFANYWGSQNYHHGLWFDDQVSCYYSCYEKYHYWGKYIVIVIVIVTIISVFIIYENK